MFVAWGGWAQLEIGVACNQVVVKECTREGHAHSAGCGPPCTHTVCRDGCIAHLCGAVAAVEDVSTSHPLALVELRKAY